MDADARRLLDDAMRLTESDRAELAARLIESLSPEFEEADEEAWAEEIQRRLDDLHSGRVKSIPWEEVRRTVLGTDNPSDGQ